MDRPFTALQGQCLAYISAYTKLHGRSPAEVELQRYFGVTPPSVHNMILTLERRGLITRTPGRARSVEVLVPRDQLPALDGGDSGPERAAANPNFCEAIMSVEPISAVVGFITVEASVDLIVSFVIAGEEPDEVVSLILLRTPKFEHVLPPEERGVRVSH